MTNTIYSTGVFLKPVKVKINDGEQWRWVAVGFTDESYKDGEEIDVYDYADSYEGLFIKFEE